MYNVDFYPFYKMHLDIYPKYREGICRKPISRLHWHNIIQYKRRIYNQV